MKILFTVKIKAFEKISKIIRIRISINNNIKNKITNILKSFQYNKFINFIKHINNIKFQQLVDIKMDNKKNDKLIYERFSIIC